MNTGNNTSHPIKQIAANYYNNLLLCLLEWLAFATQIYVRSLSSFIFVNSLTFQDSSFGSSFFLPVVVVFSQIRWTHLSTYEYVQRTLRPYTDFSQVEARSVRKINYKPAKRSSTSKFIYNIYLPFFWMQRASYKYMKIYQNNRKTQQNIERQTKMIKKWAQNKNIERKVLCK